METNKILCVGNWESDVGYAWWLMERFWEAIATKYPGQVTISWKRLNAIPPRLQQTDARFVEYDFDVHRPDLADFVRSHGFTHIYLTDQPYYCLAYAKLRMAGIKSIIVHDHAPGDRTRPTGVKRLAKQLAGRFRPCAADAYIAVSNFVLNRFSEIAQLPKARCHLAQNGIDISIDEPAVDIRAELGIPPDALLVVSSSRATKYKRIDHIIQAAAAVPAYFIHCGDGPDLPEFQRQIQQLGLSGRFFLLGRRTDVPGILKSADIAVHASTGEAACLALLEFLRAGLPIVLPDTPSVSGGFENIALVYEPGNIDQLTQQLSLLCARSDLRRSLGEVGRHHMRRFNIDDTVDAVLRVLAQQMAGDSAPRLAPESVAAIQ
jgi:glycosyltransferase involved in cell wall biosynthesis